MWERVLTSERRSRAYLAELVIVHVITQRMIKSAALTGRVIDLGCGVGERTSIAASETDAQLVGIDLSGVALQEARERHPDLKLAQGDLLSLPFADDSFDGGMLTGVIEHVQDSARLLREARRVIRQGGQLFVSVTLEDRHKCRDHVHVFYPGTVQRALEVAGFELESCPTTEFDVIFATATVP